MHGTILAVVHVTTSHFIGIYIWPIDRDEQIRCRINQSITTDCKAFRQRTLSSTEHKTVLYSVDKGLCGRNVLQSVAIDSAMHSLIKIYSLEYNTFCLSIRNNSIMYVAVVRACVVRGFFSDFHVIYQLKAQMAKYLRTTICRCLALWEQV